MLGKEILNILSFYLFIYCIIYLQCCTNLCCIAKALGCTYIYIYILFLYSFPNYGLSQDTEYSSWCCTLAPWFLSILNVTACIYQSSTLSPSLFIPTAPWHECIVIFFFLICSEFCHTLKWNSHGFTCVPHPDPPSHLTLHPIPLGLPSAPGLSTCLMHPTWAGDLFHPR